MSATTSTQVSSGDPVVLPSRWIRLLRAAALLVIGFAVAFTATFHEQFTFDFTVISASLVIIGCTHVIEWSGRRGTGGAPVALLIGIISVLAGILILAMRTELTLAVIVASWALVSALLEFVGMTVVPGSRQEAPIIGAAGVLLAITVLLSRNDLVAVIGFFGAYAVIAGVFLGIAAFDSRRNSTDAQAEDGTMSVATPKASAATDEI